MSLILTVGASVCESARRRSNAENICRLLGTMHAALSDFRRQCGFGRTIAAPQILREFFQVIRSAHYTVYYTELLKAASDSYWPYNPAHKIAWIIGDC